MKINALNIEGCIHLDESDREQKIAKKIICKFDDYKVTAARKPTVLAMWSVKE